MREKKRREDVDLMKLIHKLPEGRLDEAAADVSEILKEERGVMP